MNTISLLSGITVILLSSLRSLIRAHMKESLLSWSLLDLLSGVEQCMCGLELGVVLDIYDVHVYCLYLWTVIVWQSVSWSGSSPSPVFHLLTWSSGGQSGLWSVLRSAAGLSGAILSHTLMSQVVLIMNNIHHNLQCSQIRSGCMTCLTIMIRES